MLSLRKWSTAIVGCLAFWVGHFALVEPVGNRLLMDMAHVLAFPIVFFFALWQIAVQKGHERLVSVIVGVVHAVLHIAFHGVSWT